MSEILLSWSFSSKKQRSHLWYIIMLSIAIWLVIWGVLSKQYWMSIVIIILVWFALYIENNSDELINVVITNEWVRVYDSFYSFSNISNFAIIYENEHPILLRLKVAKKIWYVNIDIDINQYYAEKAREILLKFLKEDKKAELSVFEKILRILKI